MLFTPHSVQVFEISKNGFNLDEQETKKQTGTKEKNLIRQEYIMILLNILLQFLNSRDEQVLVDARKDFYAKVEANADEESEKALLWGKFIGKYALPGHSIP